MKILETLQCIFRKIPGRSFEEQFFKNPVEIVKKLLHYAKN